MKYVAALVAIAVAVSSKLAVAQTADHAPTKPAADAAARYDRSIAKSGHDDPKAADDGAAGSSSGTGPSAADNDPPANGSSKPNSNPEKPK